MKSPKLNVNLFDKVNHFIIIITIVVFLIPLQACDALRPCGECFTPPESLRLILVDELTYDDLLVLGQYQPDTLQLYYLSNGIKINVNFDVYGNDTLQIINCQEIGFLSTGSDNTFFLYLDYMDTDTIFIQTKVVSENCCTWHETDQLLINGLQPEYDYSAYAWVIKKNIVE